MTVAEQIDKILSEIPLDKIRSDAYEMLSKDGLIKGKGEDIYFMVLEQVDLFKLRHMKKIKSLVWDVIFRRIRKNLSHGIKEYTQKRAFEDAMKEEMSTVDIGDAATA